MTRVPAAPAVPVVAAMALALAGCMVGPNYKGPPAPLAGDRPVRPGFVRAGDLPLAPAPTLGPWWRALADPVLDDLVARALAANPNVAQMQAKLRQARAQLRTQRADLLPNGSATATYAHIRLPPINYGQLGGSAAGAASGGNGGTGGGSTGGGAAGGGTGGTPGASGSANGKSTSVNLYNLGFDASWEIDLFGGQRRNVEAQRAAVEAAEWNVADTQVSLTAEVAQAYVNLRDRQARIALNDTALVAQDTSLALSRQRYAGGTASRVDVAQQENQIENTRAQNVALYSDRAMYLNELAMLIGDQPGAVDALLAAPAALPLPPATVALGDPADLLRNRPDIRAAERTLAQDTAKIGNAEAARFPQLKLIGLLGIGGNRPADLTHLENYTAIGTPMLSWNFLDFGRGAAGVENARGVRDEAEAQYRMKVTSALQDAETALAKYRYDRVDVAVLARAAAAADEAARLDAQRFAEGTLSMIDLISARQTQITAAQNLSQAKGQMTNDFVSLQKALGLGWATPDCNTAQPQCIANIPAARKDK